METWAHTADLDADFFPHFVGMCARLECAPLDLLGCWMSESGVCAHAYNKGGDAAGIFQAIAQTREGLGFKGTGQEFCNLGATKQLVYAELFYKPHRGHMPNPAACYLATFLPALMGHASESTFVLCGWRGPFAYAYNGNKVFDKDQKGYITVGDLGHRIELVTRGVRWDELVARVAVANVC